MKIIAVDDEKLALNNLERNLKKCLPEAEFVPFLTEQAALDWLNTNSARVALLDIHIGTMGGINLAMKIRALRPECSIIFVTGFSEYAVQAFALKVSGYLLKPVSQADLKRELEYALGSDAGASESEKRTGLVVQCFGNFEVFYNGNPVSFPRKKCRELLAYLVDRRGAQVTMAEITAVLWEDGEYTASRNSQIHTFIHDLTKTLRKLVAKDVVLKSRNAVAIDVGTFDCDYYRFLDGDVQAINSYCGEYMTQYWWAEPTAGTLTWRQQEQG